MGTVRHRRDEIDRLARAEQEIRLLRLNHAYGDVEVLDLEPSLNDGWQADEVSADSTVTLPKFGLVRVGNVVSMFGVVAWLPSVTAADSAVTDADEYPEYDAFNLITIGGSGAGNLVGINTPQVDLAASGVLIPPEWLPDRMRMIQPTIDLINSTYKIGSTLNMFLGRFTTGANDGYGYIEGGNKYQMWSDPKPTDSLGRTHFGIPANIDVVLNFDGITWVVGAADAEAD
jgi:hypothetical protein